jgi:hypothetical protein
LFDRVVYKPPDPEDKKDDDAVVTPPQITELSDFDRIRIARENLLSAMQYLEWRFAHSYIRDGGVTNGVPKNIFDNFTLKWMVRTVNSKCKVFRHLVPFRSRNVEVAEQVVERRARQKAQRLPSESEQEPEPDYDDLIDQVMEPLLGGQKEVGRVIDRYESGVLLRYHPKTTYNQGRVPMLFTRSNAKTKTLHHLQRHSHCFGYCSDCQTRRTIDLSIPRSHLYSHPL